MSVPSHIDKADTAAISDRLKAFARTFDERFQGLLETGEAVPEPLADAIAYSALSPGKRLRPFMVIKSCEAVGGQIENAWAAAAAIECVHAFSLIHDDLPAMDDDDLRRGQPTCHKRFGEAIAILAGDALLALAFEILARREPDQSKAIELIRVLSRATGRSGMIGGQAADIIGQDTTPCVTTADYIHDRKTASLFAASCRLGAIAGNADRDQIDALERFGLRLGRAFQIVDDLLDVSSSPETLGKQVGKDHAIGKQSYPACVGIEESRQAATARKLDALRELEGFPEAADSLRQLASYVVDRNY